MLSVLVELIIYGGACRNVAGENRMQPGQVLMEPWMVAGTTGGAGVRFNIQAGPGLNPAEPISPSSFSFSLNVTSLQEERAKQQKKDKYCSNNEHVCILITDLWINLHDYAFFFLRWQLLKEDCCCVCILHIKNINVVLNTWMNNTWTYNEIKNIIDTVWTVRFHNY